MLVLGNKYDPNPFQLGKGSDHICLVPPQGLEPWTP